jgi:Protein of unknown function (DUF3158).
MPDLNSYKKLKQGHSLKGFLKPFKGKRDLIDWVSELEATREEIYTLMSELLVRVNRPPYSLLDLTLHTQSIEEKKFLRWRTKDLQRMGNRYFYNVIKSPKTPEKLLEPLMKFEEERLTLNMQVSSLNNLIHLTRKTIKTCEENEEEFAKALKVKRS